jgi:hypothetical protein
MHSLNTRRDGFPDVGRAPLGSIASVRPVSIWGSLFPLVGWLRVLRASYTPLLPHHRAIPRFDRSPTEGAEIVGLPDPAFALSITRLETRQPWHVRNPTSHFP